MLALTLLASMIAGADRIGEGDERAEPRSESRPRAIGSGFTSPIDPGSCQLGGRRFGCDFHPKKKRMKMHSGWDFQARPKGNPVIRAIAKGKVIKSGRLSPECGTGVQIQHGPKLFSYYCHLSSVDKAMKVGSPVEPGQTLGRMGASGGAAGVHLHFVMASCDKLGADCAIDPAEHLNPGDMCNESLPDRTRGKRC